MQMHFLPLFLAILYIIWLPQSLPHPLSFFSHDAHRVYYVTKTNLQLQDIVMDDPAWLIKLVLFSSIIVFSGIYFRIFAVTADPKKTFDAVENIVQKEIYYTPQPVVVVSWAEKLKNDLVLLKLSNYMQQREQAVLQFDCILSEYLFKRWELNSEKFTSPEIINIVKGRSIPSNEVEHLNILLTQADIIKFSQMLPREFDWQYLFTLMENALKNV